MRGTFPADRNVTGKKPFKLKSDTIARRVYVSLLILRLNVRYPSPS